jgi:AbrB family looped-hinge helix DNA binding protein
MHVVGTKGQVVIAKELREKLGVEPGWLTVQRLVDGHVELYFVPPEHGRSLKGILAPYSTAHVPPEKWEEASEAAWEEAVRVKMSSDPAK